MITLTPSPRDPCTEPADNGATTLPRLDRYGEDALKRLSTECQDVDRDEDEEWEDEEGDWEIEDDWLDEDEEEWENDDKTITDRSTTHR